MTVTRLPLWSVLLRNAEGTASRTVEVAADGVVDASAIAQTAFENYTVVGARKANCYVFVAAVENT